MTCQSGKCNRERGQDKEIWDAQGVKEEDWNFKWMIRIALWRWWNGRSESWGKSITSRSNTHDKNIRLELGNLFEKPLQ